MFQKINDYFFGNVEEALKKIAKVLFDICVLSGIILIIIGIIKFFIGIDEYTSFTEGLTCTLEDAIEHSSLYGNCYWGRKIIKWGFIEIVSALGILPLYAFGEIVAYLKKINNTLTTKAEKNIATTFVSNKATEDNTDSSQTTHKWLCSACGKMRDKSPCPYCGNE